MRILLILFFKNKHFLHRVSNYVFENIKERNKNMLVSIRIKVNPFFPNAEKKCFENEWVNESRYKQCGVTLHF